MKPNPRSRTSRLIVPPGIPVSLDTRCVQARIIKVHSVHPYHESPMKRGRVSKLNARAFQSNTVVYGKADARRCQLVAPRPPRATVRPERTARRIPRDDLVRDILGKH